MKMPYEVRAEQDVIRINYELEKVEAQRKLIYDCIAGKATPSQIRELLDMADEIKRHEKSYHMVNRTMV